MPLCVCSFVSAFQSNMYVMHTAWQWPFKTSQVPRVPAWVWGSLKLYVSHENAMLYLLQYCAIDACPNFPDAHCVYMNYHIAPVAFCIATAWQRDVGCNNDISSQCNVHHWLWFSNVSRELKADRVPSPIYPTHVATDHTHSKSEGGIGNSKYPRGQTCDRKFTCSSLVPHLFLHRVMINEVHPDTYPACLHGSVWFHSEFMTLEVWPPAQMH